MTAPKLRTSLLPNDPSRPAPLPPGMQRDITTALLDSGGARTIEDALAHELAASGWTSTVRTYVQMLLRSGECATFEQVMARLARAAGLEGDGAETGKEKKDVNGDVTVNGAGASQNQPIRDLEREGGLRIPERVVNEGVRVARREIESLCEIVVDDV